jgi:hypothetical protein
MMALQGAAELLWRPKPNETYCYKLGQVAIWRTPLVESLNHFNSRVAKCHHS